MEKKDDGKKTKELQQENNKDHTNPMGRMEEESVFEDEFVVQTCIDKNNTANQTAPFPLVSDTNISLKNDN